MTNANQLTHAEFNIGVDFFVVSTKEVTNRHGQYDGDILTLFCPKGNVAVTKHSRVGLTGTMLSQTPEWVFQDFEGYL